MKLFASVVLVLFLIVSKFFSFLPGAVFPAGAFFGFLASGSPSWGFADWNVIIIIIIIIIMINNNNNNNIFWES